MFITSDKKCFSIIYVYYKKLFIKEKGHLDIIKTIMIEFT